METALTVLPEKTLTEGLGSVLASPELLRNPNVTGVLPNAATAPRAATAKEYVFVCSECGAWCIDQAGTRVQAKMKVMAKLLGLDRKSCVCKECKKNPPLVTLAIKTEGQRTDDGRRQLPPSDR